MSSPFVATSPISHLRAADYNPRKITPDAEAMLRQSLSLLGCGKPIIATRSGVIVAGHQRTRQLRALGVQHAPVYYVEDVGRTDEVRFNQAHNSTDYDGAAWVPPAPPRPDYPDTGTERGFYVEVPPEQVGGEVKQEGAVARSSIILLIQKYGPWGAAIALPSGDIVASAQYALACRTLGIPCRVYYLPSDVSEEETRRLLGGQYGQFDYAHLDPKPYMATYAQPNRSEDYGDGARVALNPGYFYDHWCAKNLGPSDRLLDFGSGLGVYARATKAKGYHVEEIEFFRRVGGKKPAIDTTLVHQMIESTLRSWRKLGPFSVVMCEAVVNSVVSQQAEDDVCACLAAFCALGGTILLSGRSREQMEAKNRASSTRRLGSTVALDFLDPQGFTGRLERDQWFMQKFHTKEQALALASRWFGDDSPRFIMRGETWKIVAQLKRRPPLNVIEEAMRREFDLEWPGGLSVDRGELAVQSFRYVVARFGYQDSAPASTRGPSLTWGGSET